MGQQRKTTHLSRSRACHRRISAKTKAHCDTLAPLPAPVIVWSCERGNEVMNGGCVSISRQAAAALRHASHWLTCHVTGAASGWFVAKSSTGLCYSNSTQQTLSINNLLLIDFQWQRTSGPTVPVCLESLQMHLPLTVVVALVTAPAHM